MGATVRFNVGGQLYEVSRSLLESHPNSMLTTMASPTWQKDGKSELYIERDGEQFRYCLNFMRDGRASLPITLSKEAILKDLDYYGLQVDPYEIIYDDPLGSNVSAYGASYATLVDKDILENELSYSFASVCVNYFNEARMRFSMDYVRVQHQECSNFRKLLNHIFAEKALQKRREEFLDKNLQLNKLRLHAISTVELKLVQNDRLKFNGKGLLLTATALNRVRVEFLDFLD